MARRTRKHIDGVALSIGKVSPGSSRWHVATVKVSASNSHFYSTEELIIKKLQERLAWEASRRVVRQIDPSTVPCPQLTGLALKRAIATKLVTKYFNHGEFFRCMKSASRKYPLSEKQCDAIIAAVERLKADE